MERVDQRGTLINDQLSTISGRFLRPRLLEIEPRLVPSSQAVGSARRGSLLAARCSWALFAAAGESKQSAGASFTDIRSAYYSIIRQYVTGHIRNDDIFRTIAARLNLMPEVVVELWPSFTNLVPFYKLVVLTLRWLPSCRI